MENFLQRIITSTLYSLLQSSADNSISYILLLWHEFTSEPFKFPHSEISFSWVSRHSACLSAFLRRFWSMDWVHTFVSQLEMSFRKFKYSFARQKGALRMTASFMCCDSRHNDTVNSHHVTCTVIRQEFSIRNELAYEIGSGVNIIKCKPS
jgi:hypothetical protein